MDTSTHIQDSGPLHGHVLDISVAKDEAELAEMKQLRREVKILSNYIQNLQFVTYPTQIENMKRDRIIKENRIEEIRKLRHKRAQKKYDNGNGKEKNKLRAKKYWQKKKLKHNI